MVETVTDKLYKLQHLLPVVKLLLTFQQMAACPICCTCGPKTCLGHICLYTVNHIYDHKANIFQVFTLPMQTNSIKIHAQSCSQFGRICNIIKYQYNLPVILG